MAQKNLKELFNEFYQHAQSVEEDILFGEYQFTIEERKKVGENMREIYRLMEETDAMFQAFLDAEAKDASDR